MKARSEQARQLGRIRIAPLPVLLGAAVRAIGNQGTQHRRDRRLGAVVREEAIEAQTPTPIAPPAPDFQHLQLVGDLAQENDVPAHSSHSSVVARSMRFCGFQNKLATTMFVRFRSGGQRLHVSLVETHRVDGKVRQIHVGALGSVPLTLTTTDRMTFWAKLHQRLARLSNRIATEDHYAILAAAQTRIPMPTPDERQAAQVEAATTDARFWETIEGWHRDDAASSRAMIAGVEAKIAAGEAQAKVAETKAKAAKERQAQAEAGEDTGLPGRSMTRAEIAEMIGWTAADFRHADRLIAIEAAAPGRSEVTAELMRRDRSRERAASRAVLKRLHRAAK